MFAEFIQLYHKKTPQRYIFLGYSKKKIIIIFSEMFIILYAANDSDTAKKAIKSHFIRQIFTKFWYFSGLLLPLHVQNVNYDG